MFRGGKEISSGDLGPLVGCVHIKPYIPDHGAWFAVWKTPLNRDLAANTPLAIYFTDGTLYKKLGLFELFTEKELEADIKRSELLDCPPHLVLDMKIFVPLFGVQLEYGGLEKLIPIPSPAICRMMLCTRSEDDVRQLIEALSNEAAAVREQATAALEEASLKHAAMLKSALEKTQDAEVRARLDRIVKKIELFRQLEAEIRKNPEILRACNWDEARTLYRRLTGK